MHDSVVLDHDVAALVDLMALTVVGNDPAALDERLHAPTSCGPRRVVRGRSRLPRGVFEARRLREVDAGGRVGLEGTPEAELLAHVAQRRQNFLTEQPDARLRVLVRDEAVRRPEADD